MHEEWAIFFPMHARPARIFPDTGGHARVSAGGPESSDGRTTRLIDPDS